MKIARPLSLSGSINTRDLGGYPAENGMITASHLYLRSDSPASLTKEDWDTLREYGVRCVIDLRASLEARQGTYVVPEQMEYCNFSLLDHIHSDLLEGNSIPASMAEMYRDLLDGSGETFAQVFEKMAEYAGQCVLFHCTAGKDRTGLVSMLLLSLVGVPEEIIVTDYAATQEYTAEQARRQQELMKKAGVVLPDYIFGAVAQTMEETLSHLHNVYGGARQYLSRAGVSEQDLKKIQSHFVKKA